MTLIQLLEENLYNIVDESFQSISSIKLKTYSRYGEEETKEKIRTLCSKLIECVKIKSLLPMVNYTESIAKERFAQGYDLHEVQTVINETEAYIWKKIFDVIPHEDLAESLGLVSTVIGAGKDSLARTYVSLATKSKVTSLNLQALFKGSEGSDQILE